MILCAGHGTRLRPLSEELPKPLCPVGDRPALAHITDRLVNAGIREMVVNTYHRKEAFAPSLMSHVPGHIEIVQEPVLLGTGGGLANASPLLGEGDVFVWNGDILAPLDVNELLLAVAHTNENKPYAGATLVIAPRPKGEGTVGVDASGGVTRLRGERFGEEAAGGDFLGISIVTSDLRRRLQAGDCLIGEGILPWLRQGRRIATFRASIVWDDIGSLRTYLDANTRFLKDAGQTSYVGATARVASGVTLQNTVIGEGAEIKGEGPLTDCVVWPSAKATAPATKTIFTTAGLAVKVE